MTRKLGVVMDPIDKITFKKDTTLALLLAADSRGWELFYMEQGDLALEDGRPLGKMHPLAVYDSPEKWHELGQPRVSPLETLDCILMRKDPPFDSEYIYSTYILEAAERKGVLVVNRPDSLRDCNEKVFATEFPKLTPPLTVTRDPGRLREFHRRHRDVIYKPLEGMGGTAIFRAREDDPNLSVIIETLTNHGNRTIMAQKYIPEIVDGDKRILVVGGETIPYCLARVPMVGETRGNLAAGGQGIVRPLSDRDREIADTVAPVLLERGILFAGLDVIGDYLTEINVTSPTCVREIDRERNIGIGDKLMEAIDRQLG